MSEQVYDELFNLPLYPTCIQLQMADQSLRFPEGVVKDVMVRIKKQYMPTDFLVLDMQGDDESLILLGRPYLYTTNANIYIGSGHIHFDLPTGKVRCQFKHELTTSRLGSNTTGEDTKPIVRLPSLTVDGKTFLARL